MSVYTLDRAVTFVAPCGRLVAATVDGEGLPEFVRDHRGWRMEVMDTATVRASRWCDLSDGCRPAVIVDEVAYRCEVCDETFERSPLPEDALPVCPDCSVPGGARRA